MKFFDAETINNTTEATVYSEVWTPEDPCGAVGFHFSWTGTPTSTITLWVSNEDHPGLADDTDWIQIAVTWDSEPAGSASKMGKPVSNLPYKHVRVKVVTASGSGTITGMNQN